MRYFHSLLMLVFLISIFTITPAKSILEFSQNTSEKVSEEKNLEEDKETIYIDYQPFYMVTYHLLKSIYQKNQLPSTDFYNSTLLRPPIFS